VTTEEKYVAAVYLVVFLVLLAYVLIIALKLQRLERELADLTRLALDKQKRDESERKVVAVG
jgi:CcmD family protein